MVTEFGTTIACVIAERGEQLGEAFESDGSVGDSNGNGVWDGDDYSQLWTRLYTGTYDATFDVDENGELDEFDWNELTWDAPGMPTPPPPR